MSHTIEYISRRMDNFELSNKPEILGVYRALRGKTQHYHLIILHNGNASSFAYSKNIQLFL